MFISSVLIYGLPAPLFRRIRATFSQFNFLCLYFSPLSGKTFNDNSTKRNPLSAHAPLSPKGKAVIGAVRHSPQKRKAVIDTACHSPRKKKRFPPSGKAFYFPTRLLNQNGRKTFSLRLNQNGGKTFSLRLNQNEQKDFQ